jgi:hypothetical protein
MKNTLIPNSEITETERSFSKKYDSEFITENQHLREFQLIQEILNNDRRGLLTFLNDKFLNNNPKYQTDEIFTRTREKITKTLEICSQPEFENLKLLQEMMNPYRELLLRLDRLEELVLEIEHFDFTQDPYDLKDEVESKFGEIFELKGIGGLS